MPLWANLPQNDLTEQPLQVLIERLPNIASWIQRTTVCTYLASSLQHYIPILFVSGYIVTTWTSFCNKWCWITCIHTTIMTKICHCSEKWQPIIAYLVGNVTDMKMSFILDGNAIMQVTNWCWPSDSESESYVHVQTCVSNNQQIVIDHQWQFWPFFCDKCNKLKNNLSLEVFLFKPVFCSYAHFLFLHLI